jgi:LCP family protein required for cell wall assembly
MSRAVSLRSPARPPRRSSLGCAASGTLLLIFMAGGLLSAYYFYATMRELADRFWTASTGGVIVAEIDPPPPDAATPGAVSLAEQPPPAVNWGRQERVNILLMGTDQRPTDPTPGRTDTMIIVSVDPAGKSVAMLSIPRDLWVPIPTTNTEDRINTAYFYGELQKYPGGGPALARRTIQYNFGVPINYYILINFVGFRKVVDALGGIDIDVPKAIDDPAYPDDTYGFRPLHIAKGLQHMNGDLALAYARTRHADSDFYRMRRQQDVLLAIKDKALQLDTITKIPALWAAREGLVKTDLKLEDVIGLAQLARDLNRDNVKSAVIDETMATGITTPAGAQVLWPDRDKIHALISKLFQASVAAAPTQAPTQIQKLAVEGARIVISNGTTTAGMAGQVADWLKGQGFQVVLIDNADRNDYAQSLIVESASRPYAQGLLAQLFSVSSDRIRKNSAPKSDVDLRLIVGADFNVKQLPKSQ